MKPVFFRLSIIAAFAGATLLGTGCSRKPDVALCGQYYRHLLQLQQAEHQGVLAALKTAQGKEATINYCMGLEKKRVECSLAAANVGGAMTCESEAPSSFFDDIMKKFGR